MPFAVPIVGQSEVEKPELFAVHVTGLKFENALERNDVKEITEICDFMDGSPSSVIWYPTVFVTLLLKSTLLSRAHYSSLRRINSG